MSGSKQTTVHRSYRPEPGYMESALELLFKQTVCKTAAEQTPKPGGPDDAEDLKHDRTATEKYNA